MKIICTLSLCLLSIQLLFAQPVITSFTPASGPAGTPITITGTGFSTTPANNTVYIGASKATVTASTATTITATAPASTAQAPISVTVSNLTAYSRLPFMVTSAAPFNLSLGSFTLRTDFPAGDIPTFPALADFDSDGKVDMVVANQGLGLSNAVSVFRNTSSQGSVTMTDQLVLTSGLGPAYIANADFDGDGKIDIAVSNNGANTVSIFRNTTTGSVLSFASKVDVTIDLHVYQLHAYDMDGNGKPDLIARSNSGVSTIRNTSTVGTISFAPKFDMAGTISPNDIEVVDFDGDGKRDVALLNFGPSPFTTPQVSIFINTSTSGSISYATAVNFALPSGSYTMASGDIDGDGKPDIAAVTTSPNLGVSIYLNNSTAGSASLTARQDIAMSFPSRVLLSDISGDGKNDLIVLDPNYTLSYAPNTSTAGNISFGTRINTSFVISDLSTGDIDGDGKQDIVAAFNNANPAFVFRNTSNEPVITSVNGTGRPGATISLGGYHLTNISSITFGGVPVASFTYEPGGSIYAVVGSGASGDIVLTTDKGTTRWPGFVVSEKPVISSIPFEGLEGATVSIGGVGFNTSAASNIVRFGTAKAEVVTASPSTLTVKVPNGSTFDKISVTNNGLTGKSDQPFSTRFEGGNGINANSFSQKTDFASAANPDGIAVGDLNNDGKPDLAVANPTNNTVSLFINSVTTMGIPAYAPHAELTTGISPRDIAIDDFDNDGNLDIVVSNSGAASVSVFRNQGSGTFNTKLDFAAGTGAQAIATGDVDADGRMDIVVVNKTAGTVSVLINTTTDSNIAFAAHSDFTVGISPAGVAIGDLNRDGRPEIAVTNSGSNTVSVFTNKSIPGTLSLGLRVDHTTGTTPAGVAITKVNDNSQAVMIVVNKGGASVTIYQAFNQFGLYTYFGTKTNLTTMASPESVIVNDLDGDGKVDLAINGSGGVSVLRNISPNSFTPTFEAKDDFTAGTGVTDLVIADLDKDGFPDIATANGGSGNVSVLHNTIFNIASFAPLSGGTGTTVTIKGNSFTGATAVSFGGTAASSFTVVSSTVITAVVGAGAGGVVSVTTPLGTITLDGFLFTNAPVITSITPLSGPTGTVVTIAGERFGATPEANVVRFGAVDAEITAATSSQLTVKVPVGATYDPITVTTNKYSTQSKLPFNVKFAGPVNYTVNSFAAGVDFAAGVTPEGIAMGDFDDNGKPDVVVANLGSNNVSVFENTSSVQTIALAKFFDIETGNGPVGVVVADLDGDGKQDIATANSESSNVSVIRNASVSGSISFQTKVDYTTATNPQAIALGDFDLDGRPDLVTANFTNSGSISILRNTSTVGLSFGAKQDISIGSFPADVAVGDFNNDGKPDLVVAISNSTKVAVLINNSGTAISFMPKVEYTVDTSPFNVATADTDGDGDIDIFSGGSGGSSRVVLTKNNGQGIFATANGPQIQTEPTSFALGELNGDGFPDIVQTSGSATGSLTVLRNGGVNTWSNFSYSTSPDPGGITIADMNLDGYPDVIHTSRADGKVSVRKAVPPAITSFTPTATIAGGTVTITGTDLGGATGVSFGGTAATSFNVVSPTTITAVVASGSTGNVSVAFPHGTFSLDGFTFLPNPVITSFSPTSAAPGTLVVIRGTNFAGVSAVRFGTTNATSFTVVSPIAIEAVVGSGSTGSVGIVAFGKFFSLDGFTYLTPGNPPTIASFAPTTAAAGGTVNITGTNFTSATAVSFGGVAVASFVVNSSTSISAVVGSGASGDVSVSTPGGTATLAGFTFSPITAVEPDLSGERFSAYAFPNPSSGGEIYLALHPSWEGVHTTLDVTDVIGRTVISTQLVCKETNRIPFGDMAIRPGLYVVSVLLDGRKITTKVVVRE
jgi:IPT/TIG domain/FG-GAP-like repeat/FG-GAP repeat